MQRIQPGMASRMMLAMASLFSANGMKMPVVEDTPHISGRQKRKNHFPQYAQKLNDRSKYIPAGVRCNVDHKPKHLRQKAY